MYRVILRVELQSPPMMRTATKSVRVDRVELDSPIQSLDSRYLLLYRPMVGLTEWL